MIVICSLGTSWNEETLELFHEIAIRYQENIDELGCSLISLAQEFNESELFLSKLIEPYQLVELTEERVKFPLVRCLVKKSQVNLRKPKFIMARSRL